MSALPASIFDPFKGIDWRPLRALDIDTVAKIERAAHLAPWSAGNFSDALAAGYSMMVAQRGADLLAYGVLMLAPGEAQLLNLTVAPPFRRNGLGREMLKRMLDVARRSGASQCFLEVRMSNEGAVQLYLAEGFAPVARRPAYYPASKGREDALVMRAEL